MQQCILEFGIVLFKKRFSATGYSWRTRKRFLTTILYIQVQYDSRPSRLQWNKKRQVLINVQRFYFPAISHVAQRGSGKRALQLVRNWGKQNTLLLRDGKTFSVSFAVVPGVLALSAISFRSFILNVILGSFCLPYHYAVEFRLCLCIEEHLAPNILSHPEGSSSHLTHPAHWGPLFWSPQGWCKYRPGQYSTGPANIV